MHQGPGCSSFIWGSSTLNTRIERLWVEVGTQFARRWRAFFRRLEDRHHLDSSNPHHLWLELRLIGEMTKGKVKEESLGVHPDIVNRYCGVYGQPKQRTYKQTGAGHPPDESDESDSDSHDDLGTNSESGDEDEDTYQILQSHVSADLQGNIKHKPVKTPWHLNPFDALGVDQRELFERTLESASTNNIIPPNYGLLADEREEEDYPLYESLKCGRKRKDIIVGVATGRLVPPCGNLGTCSGMFESHSLWE
ncbi:hypothetical protein K439DRAFT_1373636 [Ramaria rubella]|nr:hypothetical protein K439DRAFT_1373636 [Ramaria rubella]